jgi:ribosomal protein L7Ae-like RNA K-turn-binding protein
VKLDGGELGRRLTEACHRRMAGLLLAAHRSGALAIGADAALAALERGAALAVVALDAGTVATTAEVAGCVATGRAIAWGTRSELGALFGERTVAICAVRHAGIGAELKRMRAAADAGVTATREGAGCSSRCPEAR